MGFLSGSVVKNPPEMHGLDHGWGRCPGEENDTALQLTGKFHEQSSLAGYNPWGQKKSQT